MTTTANWATTILRRRDVNYCRSRRVERNNRKKTKPSDRRVRGSVVCGGSFLTTNRPGASGGGGGGGGSRSVKYYLYIRYCNYYLLL